MLSNMENEKFIRNAGLPNGAETLDRAAIIAAIIKEYMSSIAKIGHQKSPRSKEWYSKVGKLGGRPKGYSPKKTS